MKKTGLLLLLLILVSCGATSTKTTTNKPLFDVLTQESYGGASIRFLKFSQNLMKLKCCKMTLS